jgi:hypothetical protein
MRGYRCEFPGSSYESKASRGWVGGLAAKSAGPNENARRESFPSYRTITAVGILRLRRNFVAAALRMTSLGTWSVSACARAYDCFAREHIRKHFAAVDQHRPAD